MSLAPRLAALLLTLGAPGFLSAYDPLDGDILFHTSTSEQSLAIQLVTKSRFSHCGILLTENGRPMVLEAAGPVKLTPLATWISRGKGGSVVVKRLRNAPSLFTEEKVAALRSLGKSYLGRPYDPLFEWSDHAIYCSELVHKVYHRALGIELASLQRIGSLDLRSAEAQRIARQRWGGPPPATQLIISPAGLYESPKLVTVHSR